MAKDTGSTYVKNVCWTISGQGMTTYTSGSFDFPSFTSATSYTNIEIGWNDAWNYNGNLCCLDWDLVDDSSGHDENVHHIYVYQGYNSGATEGWRLLWETKEHWNTNGHCYEALDDGDITKHYNPSSADAKIDAWTTYSEEFREVKNDYLLIKFVFESGDYAVHYVTAPWKWRYPTNSNIQLSSGFNRSVYKNNNYSAGSGTVIAHVSKWATYNPDISGRVYYNYTLPSNYYSLSSIDTSTTGNKTVTISTNFRCKNGAAVQTASYNVTVYGMISYNIPDLSQTEIKHPVPSGTTIYDFIPSQATASYGDGTSQTISIQNSYVSGNTDLSTPGVKNFTITIPSSATKTKETLSRSYSFNVYVSTDIPDSYFWTTNNGGSTTKGIAAVKTYGDSKYFWVKPSIVNVSGSSNYSSLKLYSSPYYGQSSINLTDNSYTLHYGDVLKGTLKSTESWSTYTPNIQSMSGPSVNGKSKTVINLKNNNNFEIQVYSSCSYILSIGANSVGSMTGLTGGTNYYIDYRCDYRQDDYVKTYSGPTNKTIAYDDNTYNLTGGNSTSTTTSYKKAKSSKVTITTNPKTNLEGVSYHTQTTNYTVIVYIDATGPAYPCKINYWGVKSGNLVLNDGYSSNVTVDRSWDGDRTLYLQHVPYNDEQTREFNSSSTVAVTIPKRTAS